LILTVHRRYDLVLTAETIYEEKASHRLLLCIDKLLVPTLETTQGQIDGFFSLLPFKCYLPEVGSVEG